MVDNYNFSICLWYIFWKLKPNNELCLLICYFEYLSFKICDIKDWEINTGVREYINLWHRMEKESSVLNLDSRTTGFTNRATGAGELVQYRFVFPHTFFYLWYISKAIHGAGRQYRWFNSDLFNFVQITRWLLSKCNLGFYL